MNCELMEAICAPATATGGALSIIRISGTQSLEIISRIFSKDLTQAPANTIHYGNIIDKSTPCEGDAEGSIIDDVLVSVFHAPHSYTGEDSVEISCHGSAYITNKILECLMHQGCRMAEPGEYTRRAYLNGKLDLSQAEAVADLIASNNATQHRVAMQQMRGGVSTKLHELRDKLLHITSLLELELDFSDHEELEFADRSELLELAQIIERHIADLARTFEAGQAIKNGIPVAIVGAPNVGKSTLLNALLNDDRAIVSDIQGTTRDTIEDTMQIGGITFRFIDTAGIRYTDDKIERMGIDRSIVAAQKAQVIIMMKEPGVPYPDIPVRADQTIIHIENKTEDFQAKHGIGIDHLRQQLLASVPQATDSDVIITNARHYEALTKANESLHRVIEGLGGNTSLPSDLIAENLRDVLSALSEITGEGRITPNEVLNNIFSHFCVGK